MDTSKLKFKADIMDENGHGSARFGALRMKSSKTTTAWKTSDWWAFSAGA